MLGGPAPALLFRTGGFCAPGDHRHLRRSLVVCSVHGALLWVRRTRFVSAGREPPAEVRATQQRATSPGSLLQRWELRQGKGAAFFLGLREPIQIPTAGVVICLRAA